VYAEENIVCVRENKERGEREREKDREKERDERERERERERLPPVCVGGVHVSAQVDQRRARAGVAIQRGVVKRRAAALYQNHMTVLYVI
jgi:hypothetical protein